MLCSGRGDYLPQGRIVEGKVEGVGCTKTLGREEVVRELRKIYLVLRKNKRYSVEIYQNRNSLKKKNTKIHPLGGGKSSASRR
ncbi:uncharacterized protein LOC142323718 isoform X2 [Lycorma delicatula]|uniref:uncharacterized protein LOC142323718 isoform X2 n=1 Tax=Lycorma delicatula TaxID=130591 RepID=UPI003F50D6B6